MVRAQDRPGDSVARKKTSSSEATFSSPCKPAYLAPGLIQRAIEKTAALVQDQQVRAQVFDEREQDAS